MIGSLYKGLSKSMLFDKPARPQAQMIGFTKPRYFQRLGHFAPLSLNAFGDKSQATRCAGGR
jgi:hypothetical protein